MTAPPRSRRQIGFRQSRLGRRVRRGPIPVHGRRSTPRNRGLPIATEQKTTNFRPYRGGGDFVCTPGWAWLTREYSLDLIAPPPPECPPWDALQSSRLWWPSLASLHWLVLSRTSTVPRTWRLWGSQRNGPDVSDDAKPSKCGFLKLYRSPSLAAVVSPVKPLIFFGNKVNNRSFLLRN